MIAWTRVTELRDEIGEADFAEVVALFLDEVGGAVANLPCREGPAEMAAALHFLKGAAMNLGFRALAEMCRAHGRTLSAGSPADLSVIAGDVRRCYAASRELFLLGLSTRQTRTEDSVSSSVMSRQTKSA